MFHDPKFWLAIAFFAFLGALIKFGRAAILKGLEAKSKAIAEEILAAKELKEKAAQLLDKAEKYAKESESYAAKLLQDAENEACRFADEAKQMMEAEVAKKTAASLERIKMEEVIAIREIKSRIVSSALKNLAGDLSENVSGEEHNKLIAKALIDFEKTIH